ncbi:unnamed protein product [Paramecium pentaurelia]|uniref:Protein kinase domain-containing protein n=1 Tax=Paramecium pentaurelia TaxID=43138 RepID=A0A8S1VZ49_9CILI|nr:unnamed protein product [Paramecium pentaurelia]
MQQSDFIILSIAYLANEIQNNQQKDKLEDVWHLGVIWYQMLTGKIIIKNSNNQQIQQNIHLQIEQNGNQIDQKIKNLLQQMLVIESQNRITFDQLIQQLSLYYSNQTNFNFQNLQYNFNDQRALNNYNLQLDLEKLENQFKQEMYQLRKKKQISMKKAMIDIIQDEIYQNFFLLQDFNSDKQAHYLNEKCDKFVNYKQSNIEKWLRKDNLFLQIQQQFQVYINELILYQKEKIEQRWLVKEKQIEREMIWQIKQQLLLEYKLQIFQQENQNRQTESFQSFQQTIIKNVQNQLNILSEYLNNSIIQKQKQQKYIEFKDILTMIQQDLNQQQFLAVEIIIKLQRQLINITIDIDSLYQEIELEQLGNKLQRDKITILNKSKNLLREYFIKVDYEILILGELRKRNSLTMGYIQQDHYLDHKIKTLNLQNQHLIQEERLLSQVYQNQQIDNMLFQIQQIKFFNEKINKFINQLEQEAKQFQSERQMFQIIGQNNLQKDLEDLINHMIYQLNLMEIYFQVGDLCCKDINEIKKQYENNNDLLLILNRQSYDLQECQKQLKLNNLVIQSNLSRFDQKEFFKQNCSKVYQQTLENFTYKIQEIIYLKEQVRNRFQFYEDEDFFKQIIESWNQVKTQKEQIKNMLQDIKETQITIQTNKDLLQEQIQKIKGLIIKIKFQHQLKPSFAQIQTFNKKYVQNQSTYLDLLTLVIYIKLYYNSIFLNLYLSLKSNNLEKLNLQSQVQNQVIIDKKRSIKNGIEESRQKQAQIHNMMEEYLKCLQKKNEAFEITKLQQDYNSISYQNQTLKDEIIQIIKVKLKGCLNDQQLINQLINNKKIFEISSLFCYNLVIE